MVQRGAEPICVWVYIRKNALRGSQLWLVFGGGVRTLGWLCRWILRRVFVPGGLDAKVRDHPVIPRRSCATAAAPCFGRSMKNSLILKAELLTAKTEEDVKDAYIKALGLKSFSKGLVDIQTEEVWFEAKEVTTSPIVMFGQLLVYVRAARKRGEPIPAFLAVMDRHKAAIMPTEKALPIFDAKEILWPKSGSAAGKDFGIQIAPYVEAGAVSLTLTCLHLGRPIPLTGMMFREADFV